MTDRVPDLSDVLPGVAVGTRFFDGEAGDTMAEGKMGGISVDEIVVFQERRLFDER